MKQRHNFFVGMAFILPALAIYLFYFVLPIPGSFYYSFFQWNGISKTQYKLTKKRFELLQKEFQVPAETVTALKPLRDQAFDQETVFFAAIEKILGAEQTSQYRQAILNQAYTPGMKYLGWGNWQALLHDPVLWQALKNNLILVVSSIILQLPVGLLLGIFISSSMKGTR